MNYYKDPYETTRISWNVTRILVCGSSKKPLTDGGHEPHLPMTEFQRYQGERNKPVISGVTTQKNHGSRRPYQETNGFFISPQPHKAVFFRYFRGTLGKGVVIAFL